MTRAELIAELEAAWRAATVRACSHVVRHGETSQDDEAYRALFGWRKGNGKVFKSFAAHPRVRTYEAFDGQFVKNGRIDFTTAAGAYQATWTTWSEFLRAVGPMDFSPRSQDLFFVWCVRRRGALPDALAGNVERAMYLCRDEWASLPDSPHDEQPSIAHSTALRVYREWLARESAKTAEAPQPIAAPPTQEAPNMDPLTLSLIGTFGGEIVKLIPQVFKFFDPAVPVRERNVGAATAVLNTMVEVTKAPDLGAALTAMKADPVLREEVVKAVVTHPEVIGMLEVTSAGAAQAQEFSIQAQNAERPFWYNPTFVVTCLLLPLMYWIVGSILVGGVAIPESWPVVLQFIATLFGTAFSSEMRAGAVQLVIGLVLGGICGIFYGTTYAASKNAERQQRSTDAAPPTK